MSHLLRNALAALAVAAAMGAQAAPVGPMPGQKPAPLKAQPQAFKAPQLRQVAENTFEFSYCDGTVVSSFGANANGPIEACMRLDDPMLRGMKIVGLRVPQLNISYTDADWCKIWLTSTLKKNTHDIAEDDATLEALDAEYPAPCSLSGTFTQPYTIGQEPVYIGYTLDIPDVTTSNYAGFPIAMGFPMGEQGTCFLCASVEDDFAEYSQYGPLTAVVVLQKDDLAANSLVLKSLVSVPTVEAGQPLRLVAAVANYGSAQADKVGYRVEVDGQTYEGEALTPNTVATGVRGRNEVVVDLTAIATPGTYPATLTLASVNGQDNSAEQKSLTFDLTVTPKADNSAIDGAFPMSSTADGNKVMFIGAGQQYRGWYEMAMQVADPTITGMKVVGVKVTHLGYNGMGNYNAWTSTTLDGEPNGQRTYGSVDADGNLVITFPEPVTVTDAGLYVGYREDVLYPDDSYVASQGTAGPLPIEISGTARPGGCFLRYLGLSDFVDYAGMAGYGSTMTVYLSGERPDNSLMLGQMTSYPVVVKGQPVNMDFTVSNCGGNDISSITYSYTVDGAKTEKTVDLPQPIKSVLGQSETLTLDLGTVATQGKRDIKVTIDKVNGAANLHAADVATAAVSVLDYAPAHRPLMEEITGTWCGYCPRGAIGMRELAKTYPDFIGVAYHNGDQFSVTQTYPWNASGLPGCTLDRSTGNIDPFYGNGEGDMGIKDDYDAVRACAAPCDIELATSWANDDKSALDANVTVTFALDDAEADYKVGYMLVGESYCYPGDYNFTQTNYFSGEDHTGSLLQEVADMDEYILGYEWKDVVIETADIFGVEKSIPASVKLGQPVKHSKQFQTPSILSQTDLELAADKDNLAVVAFVVDDTGRVVNAAKALAGSSAIGSTLADQPAHAAPVYYDIMGRRVADPANGVYVKVTDGKAVKVKL